MMHRAVLLVLTGCCLLMSLEARSSKAVDFAVQTAPRPLASDELTKKKQIKLSLGKVIPEIVSLSDPAQSYALYLPTTYRTDHQWPVVVIMDPRGRAVSALENFRPGAEELGYVLVSSYGTLSDSPDAFVRNQAAVDAMLKDLPRLVSVDPPRLYLAGFSGTSRVAWVFGLALKGNVAGIIGCGGGLPEVGPGIQEDLPFAYFGVAGSTDFNYQEMRRLDRDLEKVGANHRLAHFEGGHQWMPPEVATEALTWMRLRAVAGGLQQAEPAWIRERFEAALGKAKTARDEGDALAALLRFEEIVEDFSPWLDVAAARQEAAALRRSKEVSAARARQQKLTRQEEVFETRFDHWFEKWRSSELVSLPGRSLAELQIENLRRLARGEDPEVASSARRRLSHAFVQIHASLAQQFRNRRDFEREVALLQIAVEINPQHRGAQFKLAKAFTRWGRYDPAFEALEKAVASGPTDRLSLEQDPELAPLRQRRQWQQVLQQISQRTEETSPR